MPVYAHSSVRRNRHPLQRRASYAAPFPMGSIRVACCSPVIGRVTGSTDRAQPNSSAPGLRYLDKDNLVSCPRNSRYIVAIKMCRRLGKRVGGSACWRIGVWGSKTAFRHGYNDQEVSAELMMLCKGRHADTPIRPYVSPSRPIFNATLRAAASWLFIPPAAARLARPV